jgi:hypothetical protein
MSLFEHRVVGDLQHATRVMRGGVTFGNHQAVDAAARDYVTDHMHAFMKRKGLA